MTNDQLKSLRLSLKLTQAQMAKLLHRSRSQYIRYEQGGVIDGAVMEIAEKLGAERPMRKGNF